MNNFYNKNPNIVNADPLSGFLSNDPTNQGRKSLEGMANNKTGFYDELFLRPAVNPTHASDVNVDNYLKAGVLPTVGRPKKEDYPTMGGSVVTKPTTQAEHKYNPNYNPVKSTVVANDYLSLEDKKTIYGESYKYINPSKTSGSYAGVDIDFGVKYTDFMEVVGTYSPELASQINSAYVEMQSSGGDPNSDPRFQAYIGDIKASIGPVFQNMYREQLSSQGNRAYFDSNFTKLKTLSEKLNGFDSLKNMSGSEAQQEYASFNTRTNEYLASIGITNPALISDNLTKSGSIYAKQELLSNKYAMEWINTAFGNSPVTKSIVESMNEGELTKKDKEVLGLLRDNLESQGIMDLYNNSKSNPDFEKIIPESIRKLVEATFLMGRNREDDVLRDLAGSVSLSNMLQGFTSASKKSNVNTNVNIGSSKFY